MRHYSFLSEFDRARLFLHAPEPFTLEDPLGVLGVALGATLYCPATRPQLATDLARRATQGLISVVVCLEDAIADEDVPAAELNVVAQLREYAATDPEGPMIFVRVRSADQVARIVTGLGEYAGTLIGFVLPKFTEETGPAFLEAIIEAGAVVGRRLLAMPVLESPEIVFAESRIGALLGVQRLLAKYRDHILAVRIGATDLSAVYGLRRSRDLSVYDVRVIADLIADVVNVLTRTDGNRFVVTGPVWEYFSRSERIFKPQLRESPFVESAERALRAELIAKDLDGLIREVALDKANGLTGKTVIHPSHVAVVHALSVVTHEEFCDAIDILDTDAQGGVRTSTYGNKMNESKPHTAWAERIARRAQVFGVANEDVSFVDLLGAGLQR
ncbi:HpcH/HpaI aldolase/citrate lyase family protein [Micromonospora sp. R77]|uniref:HpcH/HpaI aldolase/citrate lyase family protein n=1 Tax=Micromonospora sp. R77 TaxID=2925836 RepID=UPI001F603EED|nr:HpcH/HpaI aldolase/citrate lyase family protein [Micromonospora sp. R77]MCI4066025.1 HpcH/HpaI aldolase/citrate lyase family protein [Micromonospora sp. R77]